MIMRVPVTLLLVLVTACSKGPRFGGTISVVNRHSNEFWITISGFERNPPVGALVPGGVKIGMMDAMAVSDSIIVRQGNKDMTNPDDPAMAQYSVVIPRPPADLTDDDRMALVLGADGCWFAQWSREAPSPAPVTGPAACTPTR